MGKLHQADNATHLSVLSGIKRGINSIDFIKSRRDETRNDGRLRAKRVSGWIRRDNSSRHKKGAV